MDDNASRRRRSFRALGVVLVAVSTAIGIVAASASGGQAAATAGAPVNTSPPKVSGTPVSGQTLSTSGGTWSSSSSIARATYQWLRCGRSGGSCGAIGGATASRYRLTSADVGSTIRVTQVVTNSSGSASSTSSATGIVTKQGEPAYVTPPSVSGTPIVGKTLSTAGGKWTSSSQITFVSYTWLRCDTGGDRCVEIPKEATKSYRLVAEDAGHTIRVRQNVANSSGTGTATSAPTGVVAAEKPALLSAPTISGSLKVGETVSTAGGKWTSATPITSATYSWSRCDSGGRDCKTIAKAAANRYTLTGDDQGHTLRVTQTVKNSEGSASATSAATGVVGAGGPAGAITLPDGRVSIPASSVALPNRLVVSKVSFSPSRVTSRSPFTANFVVTDTQGHVVRGALVYVIGLPYSRVSKAPEQPTATDGTATITLVPTRLLPLRRGSSLVMFVRARTPAGDLLAGASTRRLVQVRLGPA